jgi:flagellar protein FliO/FliZ
MTRAPAACPGTVRCPAGDGAAAPAPRLSRTHNIPLPAPRRHRPFPVPAASQPPARPPPARAPRRPVGVGPRPPAAARAPAPAPMPSGSATGSLLQTLFALIAGAGAAGGLAWFLKRYGPKGRAARPTCASSAPQPGRTRAHLVVEVGDQWIVVGASPGRVNALATMPRQEGRTAQRPRSLATRSAPNAGEQFRRLAQTDDR